MAIEIIIENGSNVANANSYVSVADARTYAANRGVALSIDDDEVAKLLIKATDYLESKACEYQGSPTNSDQALAWPRICVSLNGADVLSDSIPKKLKDAQIQTAMAISEGFEPLGNVSAGDYVVEETVGPITTKFADPSKVGVAPKLHGVDALLAPLCGKCAGIGLKTVRV